MPSTLEPLRDRDFRLYFTGEAVSSVGSGLHVVALGWYMLARTGSATDVALVWTVTLGAGLVALPVTGPLADRHSRRMLCIAADVLRLVMVGVLAGLAFAGTPPLWAIYLLTFVIGLGHNVFFPSIMALLQEIIRKDQLVNASGLVEVTFQVGNLTGAAVGGPLLVHFGLGWALTIDSVTYLVSAVALLALHHRPAPVEHHLPFLRMVRDGLGYLRGNAPVAAFGLVSVLPFVATISLNVVFVSYVLDVLHRSATVYGLTDMSYGAGALASGFLAALLVIRLGEWSAMLTTLVVLVCGYLALALGPAGVLGVFLLSALIGFCSSGFRVISNSVLLRVVPNQVMGRTSATIFLVSILLQVVVTLAVGPLINHSSARGGFVMLAAIVSVAAISLALLLPRLRALPAAVAESG
ncbi:MAG: MFS transporter [Gaiellales bacterium]